MPPSWVSSIASDPNAVQSVGAFRRRCARRCHPLPGHPSPPNPILPTWPQMEPTAQAPPPTAAKTRPLPGRFRMLRALVEIIAAALIPQELSLRWRPRRGKRGSAHRLPHVRENKLKCPDRLGSRSPHVLPVSRRSIQSTLMVVLRVHPNRMRPGTDSRLHPDQSSLPDRTQGCQRPLDSIQAGPQWEST